MRDEQGLEVFIRPPAYKGWPVKLFLFSLGCFLYGLVSSILAFNQSLELVQTPIPYLLLIFTLVALFGTVFFNFVMFSEVTLYLTSDEFKLTRSFGGIERSYITSIKHISAICKEEMTLRFFPSTIQFIAIYDVDRKHIIAPWLSFAEREAVFLELLAFLPQFQHEVIHYG